MSVAHKNYMTYLQEYIKTDKSNHKHFSSMLESTVNWDYFDIRAIILTWVDGFIIDLYIFINVFQSCIINFRIS